MHSWYQSNVSSILYIHGHNCNYTTIQLCTTIYGAFPLLLSPLAFISPCRFPFVSPLLPSLLTWNPPSCDRIRPPRSQVACKLTYPVPTPLPKPSPLQISRTPTAQRLTKTTSGIIRRLLSGTCNVLVTLMTVISIYDGVDTVMSVMLCLSLGPSLPLPCRAAGSHI